MSALGTSPQQLWLPGRGLMPVHVRQAVAAIREYDADLSLARHDESGEWVVTLKRGPMTEAHPVFGLGTELPAPEEIKRRLYEADVRRHGGDLVVKLMKAQDQRQRDQRAKVNDQTGVAAEAMDWAYRKEGRHPSPRIFVPKGVPS